MRTKSFKKTFFPYCINEWNNLNAEVRNGKSIHIFKKMIVNKKKENSLSSICDPLCVKLLTRLRLQFSHLNEHKFRHDFGDTVSPMYGCNAEIKNTEHLLLRCHFYSIQRFEILNNINKIDLSFTQLDTIEKVNNLLHGYPPNKSNALNQDITKFVINFLEKSDRFNKPLINDFMYCYYSFCLYAYCMLYFFC